MKCYVLLCILQLGLCIAYVIFIATNTKSIVESYVAIRWSINIYLMLLLCLLVPYAFIKNLRYLAPFFLLSNFLISIGFVIILQYSIRHLQPVSNFPAWSGSFKGLALFLGISILAYEGVGMVIPIASTIKPREAFGGWNGVLNTGMVIVTVLCVAIGFYGYLAFGDNTQSSITLNLPFEHPLYLSVQILYVISLFFTYSIQLYVPVNAIWPPLSRVLTGSLASQYGETLLRLGLVLFTVAMAAFIPHLDLMISLVGSISGTTLAIIIPTMLEVITFWHHGIHESKLHLLKNLLICLFGFVGFGCGTVVSLLEIFAAFQGR